MVSGSEIRGRLYFIFILQISIATAVAPEHGGTPGHHASGAHSAHDHHTVLKHNVILGMLAVILLLTLIFEFSHEWIMEKLEHRRQHLLIETVNTLFRELMVLGFISLFLFAFTRRIYCCVLVRTGATQKLNDRIFGEDVVERIAKKELAEEGEPTILAPTILFELFESVHIFIFVVMSIFILVVSFQVGMALRQVAAWKRYETRDFRERQKDIELRKSNYEELEFWIFHWRFLHPSTPFPAVPADPATFPFYEYLSDKLGEHIVEIVEIPFTTWIILFLITLLVRPVLDFPPVALAAFTVMCAFGILAATIILYCSIRSIKRQLRPSLQDVSSYLQLIGGLEESGSPGVAPIEQKDFVVKNNGCKAYIEGVPTVNRQERLFCFGAKGPKYLLRVLQLILFLNVVFCTVTIRLLTSPRWRRILYIPFTYWLGIVPLILSISSVVFFWPALIRDYTLCTSLELFTDRNVVEKIDDISRRRQLQRKLQIIEYLRFILSLQRATTSEEDFDVLKGQGVKYLASLSEETQSFYCGVFEAFSSSPVTMDMKEFQKAMNVLPFYIDDKERITGEWFRKLKTPGSDGISQTEFMTLIGIILHQQSQTGDIGDTPKDLFDTADVDGDGFVGLDDLQIALDGIKPPADVVEIRQLLTDIAEGSGQQVTRDAFDSWLLQVTAIAKTRLKSSYSEHHSDSSSKNSPRKTSVDI